MSHYTILGVILEVGLHIGLLLLRMWHHAWHLTCEIKTFWLSLQFIFPFLQGRTIPHTLLEGKGTTLSASLQQQEIIQYMTVLSKDPKEDGGEAGEVYSSLEIIFQDTGIFWRKIILSLPPNPKLLYLSAVRSLYWTASYHLHYAVRRESICLCFALLLQKYILLLQIILALLQQKLGIVKCKFWRFCDLDKVDRHNWLAQHQHFFLLYKLKRKRKTSNTTEERNSTCLKTSMFSLLGQLLKVI